MDISYTERGNNNLYAIRGSDYDYYTGNTRENMQVLVVVWYPLFVCVFFNREGELIEVQEQPMSETARNVFIEDGSSDALKGAVKQEILLWQRTVGFQKSAIHVKRFFLAKYHIGILDFPNFYLKVLKDPLVYSEDDRILAQEMIQHWRSEGLYELWLNDEVNLWVNRLGVAQSS